MTAETLTLINNYFKEKYDFLLECAANDLKLLYKQKLRYNDDESKYDLVIELYNHLRFEIVKITKSIKKHNLQSICLRWMKQQIVWDNTIFKRKYIYKNFKVEEYVEQLPEEIDDEDLLDIEEDYLKDEQARNNKKQHIEYIYSTLPYDQQRLYDMVFIDGYNTSRKLEKHIGVNRTSCNKMINNLKQHIRDTYKQMNNL